MLEDNISLDSDSSVASISPMDSLSQANVRPTVRPTSTYDSIVDSSHNFITHISDIVTAQVNMHMSKLANMSVDLSPRAKSLARSRPASPFTTASSCRRKAHQVGKSKGGFPGFDSQCRPSVKRTSLSVPPQPTKKFRAEIGATATPLGLPPSALVHDVATGEVAPVSPAHLRPKGEGQTVRSIKACRQTPNSQSQGQGKLKSIRSFTSPSCNKHQEKKKFQHSTLPSMLSHQQLEGQTVRSVEACRLTPTSQSQGQGKHTSVGSFPSPSSSKHREKRNLHLPHPPSMLHQQQYDVSQPSPQPSDSSDDEGNQEESPSFSSMRDFIFTRFPEARGPTLGEPIPSLPGIQDGPSSYSPSFNRAPLVDYMMNKACEAVSAANSSSKPSMAKFPSRRFLKAYRSSSANKGNKAALINQELLSYISTDHEPRVSLSQGDAIRFEEAWISLRDIQNFLCWTLGAFADVTSSPESVAQNGPMIAQMVRSIQRAMNDQMRTTVFSLANTKHARRESYLGLLPKSFSAAAKAQLRRSIIDSDLLFDGEVVKSAIDSARTSASASISEATVKALEKSSTKPNTSTVERRSTASTSATYRNHSSRPNTSFRRGDSRGYRPRSDNKKHQVDKRSGGKQPFRK